jgi:hypothetical protein
MLFTGSRSGSRGFARLVFRYDLRKIVGLYIGAKLIRSARKCVLMFAAVCFVSMASGATLQLHLLGHEHPHEHDSENCSICRQLIVSGKYIAGPELQLDDIARFEYFTDFCCRSYITIFNPKSFSPRPPPLIV